MSATDDLLGKLQADVHGILCATPSLALANKILDDKGDLESGIENELSTIKEASGKAGLAVITLAAEVAEASENMPGPEIEALVYVQVIEMVELNRSAQDGTGITSAQAALRVLKALHHFSLDSHVIYPAKKPIRPHPVRSGFVSHLVVMRTLLHCIPSARPAAITASWQDGDILAIRVSGSLSNGADPVVFPSMPATGTVNGKPTFYAEADGLEFGAVWEYTNDDGWHWRIGEDVNATYWTSGEDVANPSLVQVWIPLSPATGMPVVTAVSGGELTLSSSSSPIYYTTDGSFPTTASPAYSIPITGLEVGAVVRACVISAAGPGDLIELTITP